MNPRQFLAGGPAAAPVLLGRSPLARAVGGGPLALATADQQAHVAAVALGSGTVVRRIPTRDDPRSIEHHGRGPAVVAHTAAGQVSLLDAGELQPRHPAIGRGGELAHVTDSGAGGLAVVDLVRERRMWRRSHSAAAN